VTTPERPSTLQRLEQVWVKAAAIVMISLGVTAEVLTPLVCAYLLADINPLLAGLVGLILALFFWPSAVFLVVSVRRLWPPTL
jgi:hypothetical protein